MKDKLTRYARDPVAFLDDLVHKNELGQPFRLFDHQREILRLAFAFDADGRLPWDTILYACPKKSGKTGINGALTAWWAFTQEPPTEILLVANDLEQAQGREFKAAAGIIQHNPALAKSAEVGTRQIALSNGTTIVALASEYAGAAGSNHGLTSWDELWAYTSESSTRLWEELTPVPTRKNSIRLISSYAGWEGESVLLHQLYKQSVGADEHPEGHGERLHARFPIYANRAARILAYWDHEPRMPWQTQQYYESQRRTLRPGTYLRLHENRWTTAETTFITPELWDPCVDPSLSPLLPTRHVPVFAGVDASSKGDTAAVVSVHWSGDHLALGPFRIWRPSASAPLDLEGTIEVYLRDLQARYQVAQVLCDPWQLHRSITTLKAAGIPIEEFPQSVPNTTRMGQALFELLQGRNLRLYPSEDLRAQALNTVAIETPRGQRIAKEKASKKIDAIVALAMACVAAIGSRADAPNLAILRFYEQQAQQHRLAAQAVTVMPIPAEVVRAAAGAPPQAPPTRWRSEWIKPEGHG